MHDPNKFKTKYAKRKGWGFEEGLNYNQQFNSWRAFYALNTQSFPYGIGFDSIRGDIKHRDFRSSYRDPKPATINLWYENPHSYNIQSRINNRDNDMVYKQIYAKIGPAINEFVYPFKLGDLVEIVKGRDKGARGPIAYINEKHNYIIVKGCNIDYSIKATKNVSPREVGLLPKHIRLVNPTDTKLLVEEVEFFYNQYDEIIRCCKTTGVKLPWDGDSENKGQDLVKNGGAIQCKVHEYPVGSNDSSAEVLFESQSVKLYHNELEEGNLDSFEDILRAEYKDQIDDTDSKDVKPTYFY